MTTILPAGTTITDSVCTFRLVEPAGLHGCPLVEILDAGATNFAVGDKTYRTLYLHEDHGHVIHET